MFAKTMHFSNMTHRLIKEQLAILFLLTLFAADFFHNTDLRLTAISWPCTKSRVNQHTFVNIMQFFKRMAPAYADEIFHQIDK